MKPDPVDARLWEMRGQIAADVLGMAEALCGPLTVEQRSWTLAGAMWQLETDAWRAGALVGPIRPEPPKS